MRTLLFLTLGATAAFAQLAPQPTRALTSKTETTAFPSGGTLHIAKSSGELTIEAWDRPDMETAVIIRSKRPLTGDERKQAEDAIAKARVSIETKADVVSLSTDVPKEHRWKSFNGEPTRFEIDIEIHLPRTAKVAIDDHSGEVHIDDVRGDIDAHIREGELTLHLPEHGAYAIDARSKFGNITTDFPGDEKHRWWYTTHTMAYAPQGAAQKLKLRVGYGDVVILAERDPLPGKP